MDIPSKYRIHETEHWLVNHRIDTVLPGYLMVGSKSGTNALYDLPTGALVSLGPLLARAQREVETLLRPKRVYIGRYGHSPGHPIHFHIIPVYMIGLRPCSGRMSAIELSPPSAGLLPSRRRMGPS